MVIVGAVVLLVPLMIWVGPALGRWVDRWKQLEVRGAKFSASTIAQSEASKELEEPSLAWKSSDFEDPIMLQQAEVIHKDLNARGISDNTEREALLIKNLARVQVDSLFDRIYIHSYGSQLVALQALAGVSGGAQPRDDLRPLYLQGGGMGLDCEAVTFEAWLEFLRQRNLIAMDHVSVAITPFGRAFLKHLIDQSFTLMKGK